MSSLELTKNGHADPLAPFTVQKATAADAKEISDFLLTDFLTAEPLNAALELNRKESENFFTDLVLSSLPDGLSYLIRDPAEKHRLVAVRLASILRRNNAAALNQNGAVNGVEEAPAVNGDEGGGDLSFGKERPENGKVCKICAILHAVEMKTWQLVPPELNCLATWLVLSVSSNYQRRGIAAALLQYRLDEALELGCQGLITEASALNSQKLFQKLGYSRLYELPHAEWKDPASGEQIFRCKDGTDRVTLEFKPFIRPMVNGKAN